MQKVFEFSPKYPCYYHLCESDSQIQREIDSYSNWLKRSDPETEKDTIDFINRQIEKLTNRHKLLAESKADFYVTGYMQDEISAGDFFSIYHKFRQYNMIIKKVSRRDHAGEFKNPEHKTNSFFEVLGVAHDLPIVPASE